MPVGGGRPRCACSPTSAPLRSPLGSAPRPDHGCSSATRRCDPRSTSEANRRGSAPAPVSPTFPPLHCCCEPTPTGPSEGSTAISTWARTSTWSGAWQRPVTGSATNRPSSSSTRPVPACSDGSASGSSTGHRQRRWRPVIPGRWPPPVVRRGALLAGRSRCSDHGAWVHWWGWRAGIECGDSASAIGGSAGTRRMAAGCARASRCGTSARPSSAANLVAGRPGRSRSRLTTAAPRPQSAGHRRCGRGLRCGDRGPPVGLERRGCDGRNHRSPCRRR